MRSFPLLKPYLWGSCVPIISGSPVWYNSGKVSKGDLDRYAHWPTLSVQFSPFSEVTPTKNFQFVEKIDNPHSFATDTVYDRSRSCATDRPT